MKIPTPEGYEFPTISPNGLRTYGSGGFALDGIEQPRGCPRKFYHRYVLQEDDPSESYPLKYGSMFHKALELMESEGLDPDAALAEAWDTSLPPEAYEEALADMRHYLDRPSTPLDRYGTLRTETELAAPLYVDPDFGPIYIRGIIDRIAVDFDTPNLLHVVDFKGLALDTPIATPSGWTTMAALRVGDEVFNGRGEPTRVANKSDVHHRPCYRLTFDDNQSIVCDADHRWSVVLGPIGERRKPAVPAPVVMTAAELAERGISLTYGQRDVRIWNAGPLDLPDADLPIDPYVLGVWLGDGAAQAGVVCKPLPALWDEIRSRGYEVGPDISSPNRAETHTILGLRRQLRVLGLLDNKHLPTEYERASRRQRLEVLQGLMDTDGHWNVKRQRAVMSTTQEWQAAAVERLVTSLGWKATRFHTKGHGFGKAVSVIQVWFTPTTGEQVFLARVPDDYRPSKRRQAQWRLLSKLEEVPTVPTQCIEVDSPDHLYLAGSHLIPTHNTNRHPPSVEDVRRDIQGKIYVWLVKQCFEQLGLDNRPQAVFHLDAIKWRELPPILYSEADLEALHAWIVALVRKILRDDDHQPVVNEGCAFCFVKDTCPAYRSLPDLASELITVRPPGPKGKPPHRIPWTPEEYDCLVEAYETELKQYQDDLVAWRDKANAMRLLLEKAVKETDSRFIADAQTLGSVRAGGYRWEVVTKWVQTQDIRRLHQLMGEDFWDAVTTSKTRLEKIVKDWPPDLAEGVLACIRSEPDGTTVTKVKEEK